MSRKTNKKASAKADSKKRAAKRTSRKRLPFSGALAKKLGFEHEDLAAADIALHNERPRLRMTLAQYCRKYSEIGAAWERGQLLRNAAYCAETMTVSQAARWLGFETGFAFRRLLDSDSEVRDVWDKKKLETIVRGRKALLGLVDKGDARALKMLELISHDEEQGSSKAADFTRIGIVQLADLFGYSRQAVNEWYGEKGLPRNADGSFDLKTAIKWFEEFTLKKAARGKNTVGPLNPFQQVKTERERLRLLADRGELLGRGEVIGWQIAQLQNILNCFDKITDYANLIFGQPREEIVKALEDLRDDCFSRLAAVPERLKLTEQAGETLAMLFEQLKED